VLISVILRHVQAAQCPWLVGWCLEDCWRMEQPGWVPTAKTHYLLLVRGFKVGMAEIFHLFLCTNQSVFRSYFDPRLPFSPGVFRSQDIDRYHSAVVTWCPILDI